MSTTPDPSAARPDAAALAALGQRLQTLGLSERAVTTCFGVSCVGHAPVRARVLRARALHADPGQPAPGDPPPAALLAQLFVAGSRVSEASAERRLGADLAQLIDLGLIERTPAGISATVTILPIGAALVLCDRPDRHPGPEHVAVPDDSAFHTIGAVPGRARKPDARWLDVGTGSAVVPLARPGAAATVLATDINPRALARAELSAALSGRTNLRLCVADLFGQDREHGHGREHGPWDLITFNAPIPRSVRDAGPGAPLYCQSERDLLAQFWTEVRPLVAPGGEVLVHSWQPAADYPACLGLPGRVTAVRYTPPEAALAFGVTAWQPDAEPLCQLVAVTLDEITPHVRRAMLEPA